jgi:hypothetical protein
MPMGRPWFSWLAFARIVVLRLDPRTSCTHFRGNPPPAPLALLGYHPASTVPERAMNPQAFAEELRREGFDEVVDKSLPAGQYVEAHTHPFAVKALVTDGEVALGVAGVVTTYRVGDVFTMAKGCEHTERYGAQGVSYVVGRKHG